jgi:cytochrome b
MATTQSQRPPESSRRGLVWDAPVRVVHWLLVACVGCAWLTRDARLIDLHAASGYCAALLLAFRIAWGFIGPRHARFSSFAYSPRAALAYLRDASRGTPRHFTGHNPAGSWAVYALLALLALACLSGIVAIAGMFGLGPLAAAAPSARTADLAREVHEWTAWMMLAVIAGHVLGALWGGRVHHENLVASMLSGRKTLHEPEAAESPRRASLALAIVGALAVSVAAYLHLSGWDRDYRDDRLAARAVKPPASAWTKECGSCHLAYSPALLPGRSWERTFAEQDRHFGEDLSLSEAKVRELRALAAATPAPSWAAWKLAGSARAQATPLRISELPYWLHAHHDVPENAFKSPVSAGRHDCEACHVDAASGIFHPRMLQKTTRGITY